MIARTPRSPAPRPARGRLAALLAAWLAGAGLAAGPATAAPTASDTTLAVFEGGTIEPYEFVRAWQALLPNERPKGDPLASRRTFLVRMVDRKLLAREAARTPLVLTAAEQAELDRAREQMIQNELFEALVADLPPATPEELDAFRRQATRLAEVRFISFADPTQALIWRQRLLTGTPMSALDELIAGGGPTAPKADEFRWVAADQIPDTLAQVIWAMRPGQVSEVHSFAGQPVLIHLRGDQPRPGVIDATNATNLVAEYDKKRHDRIRQRLREDLAARAEREFVEEGMAKLLAGYMSLPPRNDVDSLTGMPIMRANLPLPVFTAADTGLIVARTRHGELNLVSYLRYWGRIPGYARPDARERPILEAAVDRVVLEEEILALGHARGFDRSPKIAEALERMREGFALDHYFERHIASKIPMNEAALQRYFDSRPAHYDDPATLEARILLVDRQSLADSLLALARGGRSFEELARTYSLDGATGQNGGKTGIVARGTNPNVGLEDAMFASPIGEVRGPERTPEGWVLWRTEARTPGKKRTLDEAREWVERDYRTIEGEKILEAHLAELRKKAKARFFNERITETLGADGPWGS